MTNLATHSAWVHNLSPFLVQFSPNFGIRWYGLAYLTGFIVGAMMIIFVARRGRRTIDPDIVTDFITYIVFGTMIGGRVGYALFYSPDLLTDFSTSRIAGFNVPVWGVLRVWEGGMASHGGILGIVIASVLFARRHKLDWRHLGDMTVLGGSVGIFCGRIANFINGELFGREAASWFPLPMKFPGEMFLWLKHDREKNIADLTIGADLLPRLNPTVKAMGLSLDQWTSSIAQVRVSSASRYQVQSVINDIIVAIQNGNEPVRQALGEVLTPRYPSQLIEALLEGLLLFAIAFWFWQKPRKPGVVGGLWLTCYACVRIFGEQFRMPDADIGYQLFGLTRGQWLSIAMLAGSATLLFVSSHRDVPVIGGWGKSAQELRAREP